MLEGDIDELPESSREEFAKNNITSDNVALYMQAFGVGILEKKQLCAFLRHVITLLPSCVDQRNIRDGTTFSGSVVLADDTILWDYNTLLEVLARAIVTYLTFHVPTVTKWRTGEDIDVMAALVPGMCTF